ncbi:MAG: hypothetical protein HQL35_05695 [Alphaproteobacteria bacterium]|nr:hypothetical protein [Alphaproteobacteria bacterium]
MIVHPRAILAPAFDCHARHIILAHNHPSGDPTPSPADKDLTEMVEALAEPLGITLLDHVIVAEGGVFSFEGEKESPAL